MSNGYMSMCLRTRYLRTLTGSINIDIYSVYFKFSTESYKTTTQGKMIYLLDHFKLHKKALNNNFKLLSTPPTPL